jgi:glycosyltransferase involved in cell wall biosynthesis
MRLAMIVRADNTGLGNQTRNLARLLKPERVMIIDMTKYNGMELHLDWYKDYESVVVKNYPTRPQTLKFLKGMTHLLTCEIFYNNDMISYAKIKGVKTYNQFNYEFLDNLVNDSIPKPDYFISPSYWKLYETKAKFNAVYLPPPLFIEDFKEARATNFMRKNKKPRFLHIVGKPAIHNRNGTDTIIEALKHSTEDYDLVVKTQFKLPQAVDPRLSYEVKNSDNFADLYKDFDALIYPRKFGGLALPMNEALVSGLPVIMTNIEPNKRILPKEWLVPTVKVGKFMARTMIDYYEAEPKLLAKKLDELAKNLPDKQEAYRIGVKHFSDGILIDNYKALLQ